MAQVKVRIPTALRAYAGSQSIVEVNGATVGEAVHALAKAHPELARHLFDEKGALRTFVNVYLGSEDVRRLKGLDTPVSSGQTVLIVPSVAGGGA